MGFRCCPKSWPRSRPPELRPGSHHRWSTCIPIGLTILSACSHAGIVNACLDARRLVPGRPVDTVLGGYHLAGAVMEERIDATIDDLDRLVSPRLVAPGHCTGWRAKAALADRFSPGRYAPSLVGMTYFLT
jgi:7,8-dihydropterin-6-yl-methyl-4-(beta-D-ribofuranosyl)aminobenzene 5'-phosphate synthase